MNPMHILNHVMHSGAPVMVLRASYNSETPGRLIGVLLADVDRIVSGVMPGPYSASLAAVSTLIFPPERHVNPL
jgi:hypothetical protein